MVAHLNYTDTQENITKIVHYCKRFASASGELRPADFRPGLYPAAEFPFPRPVPLTLPPLENSWIRPAV